MTLSHNVTFIVEDPYESRQTKRITFEMEFKKKRQGKVNVQLRLDI